MLEVNKIQARLIINPKNANTFNKVGLTWETFVLNIIKMANTTAGSIEPIVKSQ